MKKIYTFLRITAMLLCAFFLLSCSKKKKEETAFIPRLAPDTSCQLEIVGHYSNFEALEAEIDRFNEFYPNIEITYTFLDNYNTTIRAALANEKAPDIYMSFQWMLDKPEYAPLFESAEDMGDAKKIGFDLSTLIPQLVYHAPDGSVPKIPLLRTTQGMMVNDDLFKKEGIEIPTTYNQFVAACQKLKAAGYKSPILAYNSTLALAAPLVYAYFSKTVRTIPGAVAKLNTLSSDAGEFMRPTLEKLKEFIDMGFIDLDECNKIKNDYAEVILRFFEGDVPMMVVSADVVSGTKKREKLSESFMKQPFKYSFHTVPMTNDGGDFLSSVSVEFSVNKNSKNILVANEFIRFLIRTDELNNLAQIKRLVTCSTDYSFDEVYAALEKATPIYINEEGITDNAYTQLRNAAYQLILGNMTIDEAIANYGKF